RTAELLAEDAAHELRQRFAGFFKNEIPHGIGPREFKARRECGNPDLAHRRVRTDDEFGFFRLFEQHFKLSAPAFDFESVNVAKLRQPAAEIFKGGITA